MHAVLHLSHACNFACDYCYAVDGSVSPEMTPEIARRGIDIARRNSRDAMSVVFFGGEPLLYKDFILRVMEETDRAHAGGGFLTHYKTTTNGLLLDEAFLEVARRHKLLISLSIDGVREAHDRHRRQRGGEGTWATVDRKADLLLRHFPYSKALVTVSPDTLPWLAESVRYLVEDKGFRYVLTNINYAAAWDDAAMQTLAEQYERIAELYECWSRADRKFYFSAFEMRMDSHLRDEECKPSRCDLAVRQISIDADGGIYPCVQFVGYGHNARYRMGDVWKGIDWAEQLRIRAAARVDNPECNRCAIQTRCTHWCACKNFRATGDPQGISPVFCTHERMLFPIVDRLAERLFRDRAPAFIQKHYNTAYPALSLLEDRLGAAERQ